MRIGFFVDVFYPMVDGVVNVVHQYATILSKEHDVFVFAPKAKDKSFIDDFSYKVIRVLKIQVPNTDYHLAIPPLDGKLTKLLKDIKLDIVHIHSPFSMGELGVSYAKKYKVPLFATLHSQYKQDFELRVKLKPITNMMLKDIIKRLNKCDHTFTVNQTIRHVYKSYGLKKESYIIPNATEMTYLMGHDVKDDVLRSYRVDINVFNMLFVGRIDKIKNIKFILKALAEMKKMTRKFHLYIVGKGSDLEYFKAKVETLGLEKQVTFTGAIYDRKMLAAMYETCDLFVFPSLYDTNSLVQLEAASQKTPTIFIKGAATAHHIEDDVNGFLEMNDVSQFGKRLYLLSQDLTTLQAVGNKAYETIYHRWDDSIKILINYYQQFKDTI